MANEIHSLKIGNTEYPIYSEGIKIDTSKNDSFSGKFLVATGNSGNQTIGTSSAISGNDEELYINSSYIGLGYDAAYVFIGDGATNVSLGTSATNVSLGTSATSVYLGQEADDIYFGQNATNVSLGYSAERIQLGDFASELNIGFDASQISIGPNIKGDLNRNTIHINDVGELYMTGTHTDVSSPDYESYINMEYDSGSGAMDLNLVSGTTGTINIGGSSGAHQSSMLNINSDNIDISGTNGIQMTGSNFNFIVQPNVSTVDGFNIRHQKNSSIGIVCYTPSASAPVLYMAPRAAYASNCVVHLGTTSKRFGTLYVTNGYATSGFSTSSDERLKDFGENIEVDLDVLSSLRKSYYRWNETSGFENEKDRMIGMSAQEVQKLYPEVVTPDENGVLSMAYDRLSVVALAAIDKLHKENMDLKNKIESLEERLTKLESLLNKLN